MNQKQKIKGKFKIKSANTHQNYTLYAGWANYGCKLNHYSASVSKSTKGT